MATPITPTSRSTSRHSCLDSNKGQLSACRLLPLSVRGVQRAFGKAGSGPRRLAATGADDSPDGCSLGIVVVDHGSKRSASNDALLEFVALYKQVTGRANVEPAHMELAEPTVRQAVAACAARGARRVVVAPYFLSRGRHIQEDIPALVAAAREAVPGVECLMAAPVGVDPLMAELIEQRVRAAVAAAADDSCGPK